MNVKTAQKNIVAFRQRAKTLIAQAYLRPVRYARLVNLLKLIAAVEAKTVEEIAAELRASLRADEDEKRFFSNDPAFREGL